MIPALAFNDQTSGISTDAMAFRDEVAASLSKVNACSALKKVGFEYKFSSFKMMDTKVVGFSHNGIYVERETEGRIEIVIPLQGEISGVTSKVPWNLCDPSYALLSVGDEMMTSSTGSGVGFVLDEARLNGVINVMNGSFRDHVVEYRTRTISLQRCDISFAGLFRSLFEQIDHVGCNTVVLKKLAIEDSLYRLFGGLVQGDEFFADLDPHKRRPQVRNEINRLCEWICANLDKDISLTEMERRSGLSARILQYSFQKAFGLRPKEWLRKQRLHAARAMLVKSTERIKITVLAYEYCFPSPSVFARDYQREFGELPSQTVRSVGR